MTRKGLHAVMIHGLLFLALIVVVFPYFWMLLTSIKPYWLITAPNVWIFRPVLDNWRKVLFESKLPLYLLNSLIVGGIVSVISVGVGSLAAYSFSRFNTGGTPARFAILAAQMLPPVVLVISIFLMMYHLRLLKTYAGIIVAHLSFILPLVTWFLIGFFDEVPRELEEQAMVDGYTRFQAFYKVVLPNVRAGAAAAGIFGFVLSWNDFFYALILTGGPTKTLPVAVAGFWTFRGIEMGQMAAAIIVAIVPVVTASFFVQKHLVKGLGGGVKY